ncbi:collagen alpha-1(XIV) chain-like, partial [Lingula anatina]|uniref:Collagen alpha-1(XIV) chain-like n=1 Tax=Lingula anatina TaxID=7574 RepID=A0A1S3HS16_LINAN
MQGVVVVSLVGFSVVWTVVLSGYTAASAGLSNSTDCEIYAGDIVFVLDESGSIKKENWEKVLAFVQDVVQTFDIGPDNTYFGVVTFGNGAQKQFDLQSFPTRDGLVEAIGNISYGGGGTDTAKAIDVLRLTMFNPKNEKGGRPGIPHIGIVLTDGLSTEREATQQSAKEARDSGIILFAVGVGHTDYEELRGIASDPDDSHVFHVNDFSSFQLIHDKLVRDVCHDCEIYAGDIVFALDESGSIEKDDWEKVLAFVQDVVQTFDIGPDNTYFGVVTFGNGAQRQFDLQSFPTRDGLVEAIGNISYGGGRTDTAKAIDVLRVTMFNPKNEKGGRPGIPHIGIILTDGLSTEREATQQSAKEARDSGIILFAVGVGHTDYEELRGIASDPDDSHVFHVNDFSSFQFIHDKLVRDVCHDLCPKDWKRIGNKCFFLSSYQTSCLQASKRCTALHYKARL